MDYNLIATELYNETIFNLSNHNFTHDSLNFQTVLYRARDCLALSEQVRSELFAIKIFLAIVLTGFILYIFRDIYAVMKKNKKK